MMTGSPQFPKEALYKFTSTIRRTPLTQHSEFTCKLFSPEGRNNPGFDAKMGFTMRQYGFVFTRLFALHMIV